jgi:hypothetical protein
VASPTIYRTELPGAGLRLAQHGSAGSGTEFYIPRMSVALQAWAWYSLDHKDFEVWESYGHLFDPDTKRITA